MIVYAVYVTYCDNDFSGDALMDLYSTAELAASAKDKLELTYGDEYTSHWTKNRRN